MKYTIPFKKIENFNGDYSESGLIYFRNSSNWLLPQIMAFLGQEIKLVKSASSGLISFAETAKQMVQDVKNSRITWEGEIVSSTALKVLINILKHHPRSDILAEKQSGVNGLRFSSAVPLFVSAFKQYRNIPYSNWDWAEEEKAFFLDPQMVAMSEYFGGAETAWTTEQMLSIRNEVFSGRKITNPIQIYSVNKATSEPEFDCLPRLCKLCLLQFWVYNPSLYNEYAIVNLENIDAKATPLIETEIAVEIFSTEPNIRKKQKSKPEEWDLFK